MSRTIIMRYEGAAPTAWGTIINMNKNLTHKFQRTLVAIVLLLTAIPAIAAPHKRALLIGVHAYEHGPNSVFADLNTVSDVSVIRQTLIDKFGFAPADIVTLTSPEETTRQSIIDEFRKVLVDDTQPGDILYFHYSGHGSQIADPNDNTGLDETIVPSDCALDGSKDIRDKEINGLIAEVAAKHPASFLLTFDSCHSGTITRGGRMMIRGVSYEKRFGKPVPAGVPATADKSRGARMMLRGKEITHGFVVISACRDDQSAVETEDANHQPLGRLSYLLSNAMRDSGPDTTYRDLYEKINAQMLADYPGQNPVIEGDEDSSIFNGAASKPQPYWPVYKNPNGDLMLQAGSIEGMTNASQFALYPSNAKQFTDANKIATATVTAVGLTQSKLALSSPLPSEERAGSGEGSGVRAPSAFRAVETLHNYGDNRIKVDPAQFATLPNGSEIVESLKSTSIVDTDLAPGDKPDVVVKPSTDGYDLISEDGGAVIAHVTAGPDVAMNVSDALKREATYRFAKSLNNESPTSPIRIEMRMVPAEVTGDENMGISWKADKTPSTQGATLHDGEYVTIEVRNVGDEDAYVAVLDLESDGTVNQLWPDPNQPITDNVIPHGNPNKWVKLWDGAAGTPWPFQLGKPYGAEIFKAVATREHVDFSTLRGESKPASPLDDLLKAAVAGTRAHAAVRPSAWSTSTVVFDVEPSTASVTAQTQ